jgi:hypothetical protein
VRRGCNAYNRERSLRIFLTHINSQAKTVDKRGMGKHCRNLVATSIVIHHQ